MKPADVVTLVPVLPRVKPTVLIGSRWNPTHAAVRDPDAGVYYERNPRMETTTELAVQRALLSKPAPRENPWRRFCRFFFGSPFKFD